jgi:hypothetical protein
MEFKDRSNQELELDKDLINTHKSFLCKHEQKIIIIICALAAIRLFIFCAAFPFPNSTDEAAHLDTIYKYSRGYQPGKELPNYDFEPTAIMVLYRSPEFLTIRNISERYSPTWCFPKEVIDNAYEQAIRDETNTQNVEAFSPPVYYAIAAIWYKVGKFFSIQGLYFLYWIRFFNLIPYVVLIFLAYSFTKKFYPENSFLHIGVPLMVAFMPQDVLYGINREVISPTFATLSLYMNLSIYRENSKGYAYYALSGLVTALTFLTDISNFVFVALLIIIIFLKLRETQSSDEFKTVSTKGSLMFVTMMLPILVWLLRNYLVVGDLTASNPKSEYLGWTIKPFSQMLDHPIFTVEGIVYFFSVLIKSFWRGEYYWYLEVMTVKGVDMLYALSSYMFLAIFTINLFFFMERRTERWVINLICLILFATSVLFLFVISLPFDFGNCFYPSRVYPYFVSGRIIYGTVVPFLIIYLSGLQMVILKICKNLNPLLIVTLLCTIMTVSEVYISNEVFKSKFNLFSYISHNDCS